MRQEILGALGPAKVGGTLIGFLLSGAVMASDIFSEPAKVHREQAYLQDDQCIGMSCKPPDNPEDIAQDEAPEPCHSPSRLLRTNEPRGKDGDQHRRPLHPVNAVHHARCP